MKLTTAGLLWGGLLLGLGAACGSSGKPDVQITAPSIPSFSASQTTVGYGEAVTLNWTLGGGTPSTLTLDGASMLGRSSQEVHPVRRQTYTLKATNGGGTVTQTVTVVAQGMDLLAGSIGGTGHHDGAGVRARFSTLGGVCVDEAGNAYVADTNNHCIRMVTAAGVVTTIAGSPGTAAWADGIGGVARFHSPRGLALDASGNLYVADTTNHRIRKMVLSTGAVSTLAGSGTAAYTNGLGTGAAFNYPYGLAVDASGNVFVADTNNCAIRKVDTAGNVTTFAGASVLESGWLDGNGTNSRFNYPRGLAFDPSGNLYVADTSNYCIRKISSTGAVSTVAGSNTETGIADGAGADARFKGPAAVAVDADGNVLIADATAYTLRKLNVEGQVSTLAGMPAVLGMVDAQGRSARFNFPQGLALDAAGRAYVADTYGLRLVSTAGDVTTLAGDGLFSGFMNGSGAKVRFNTPYGLATDSEGNAYVADYSNSLIRKISPEGVVTTLAGSPSKYDFQDGQGSEAWFKYPRGIAVDSNGDVYVADTMNQRIRKVTPGGAVTTVAGQAASGTLDGVGTEAQFSSPWALVLDGKGNLFVADYTNNAIRKITLSTQEVVTVAGGGGAGSLDGLGTAATFKQPSGIAIDAAGNLYVADTGNYTIRKIDADYNVTTLAGTAGLSSSDPAVIDGTGAAARFITPIGLTVDGSGNLCVADGVNGIRKITPDGIVSTPLKGSSTLTVPGPFAEAVIHSPLGIAFNPTGDLIATTKQGVVQLTAMP